MRELDEWLPKCRVMLTRGASIEEIVKFLRSVGANKGISTVALSMLHVASLGEAKLIVHNSETWADTRERDEKFQNSLFDAAEKIQSKCNKRTD